jgi:hypothetical protein
LKTLCNIDHERNASWFYRGMISRYGKYERFQGSMLLAFNLLLHQYIRCSSKTTLLLGWSPRYKKYTVVIRIRLNITIYSCLKWQWIFLPFYVDFNRTSLYMWVTSRVSFKNQGSGFTPCFDGVRVAHLFSFLCWFVFCLSSACVLCFPCCQCLWIIVHSWLPLRFSLTLICYLT